MSSHICKSTSRVVQSLIVVCGVNDHELIKEDENGKRNINFAVGGAEEDKMGSRRTGTRRGHHHHHHHHHPPISFSVPFFYVRTLTIHNQCDENMEMTLLSIEFQQCLMKMISGIADSQHTEYIFMLNQKFFVLQIYHISHTQNYSFHVLCCSAVECLSVILLCLIYHIQRRSDVCYHFQVLMCTSICV